MLAARWILFRILTLSLLLPSPASEYFFNFLFRFRRGNAFFYLCIIQKVNLSLYLPVLVFSLLCFSALQLLLSKLRSFNSDVMFLFFRYRLCLTNPLSAASLHI